MSGREMYWTGGEASGPESAPGWGLHVFVRGQRPTKLVVMVSPAPPPL